MTSFCTRHVSPSALVAPLLLTFGLALPPAATAAPAEPPEESFTEPELRSELLALRERDQELRRAAIERPEDEGLREEMRAFDARATARAREILADGGWPTVRQVGVEGSGALWLLVQHTDDEAFLGESIPAMREAAERDDLEWGLVATSVDRVRIQRDEPQLYGTQFHEVDGELVPQPIEDRENLDARREEMGLPPFDEYRRLLLETYDRVPDGTRAPDESEPPE